MYISFRASREIEPGLQSKTADGLVAAAAGTRVGILSYVLAQEVQGQVSAPPSPRR